jgi:hypothetical protein
MHSEVLIWLLVSLSVHIATPSAGRYDRCRKPCKLSQALQDLPPVFGMGFVAMVGELINA